MSNVCQVKREEGKFVVVCPHPPQNVLRNLESFKKALSP